MAAAEARARIQLRLKEIEAADPPMEYARPARHSPMDRVEYLWELQSEPDAP